MEPLLPLLQERFSQKGFDIVAPFKVADYNSLVPKYPLPDFGRKSAMGVVIGSSKIFWSKFVEYLKQKGNAPADPVQTYCSEACNSVLEMLLEKRIPYDVRYDWHTPRTGNYVHIQSVGHVAGIAFYDKETMWSAHSTFGLWFVFRAVIVLDVDYVGPDISAPEPVITPIENERMKILTQKAIAEGWKNVDTLLQIRLSCERGRSEWQYEGTMLDYFYPIGTTKPEVLYKLLQN